MKSSALRVLLRQLRLKSRKLVSSFSHRAFTSNPFPSDIPSGGRRVGLFPEVLIFFRFQQPFIVFMTHWLSEYIVIVSVPGKIGAPQFRPSQTSPWVALLRGIWFQAA